MSISLSFGLAMRSIGSPDPTTQLINAADHLWVADDWTSGAFVDRNGAGSATIANGSKVASGATYDTDKTASLDLIHLTGSTSYIDFPLAATPTANKVNTSTMLLGWKRDDNGLIHVLTDWSVDKGPGFRLYASTSPACVFDVGDGVTLTSVSRNGAGLGNWTANGLDQDGPTARHWTNNQAASTGSVAALGTIQGGSVIRFGGRHYSAAYSKAQFKFLAVWKDRTISDVEKADVAARMFT